MWMTRKDRVRFVGYAPALLTSLGILGTFVGIIVGLMRFDSAHIDASIPQLLDGLKTAFITSLAGMGSAVFKLLTTTFLVAPPQKFEEVTGAGPEDILRVFLKQQQTLQNLETALAGPDDASLIGQLRRWREDQRDRRQALLTAVTELRTVIAGSETSLVGQLKLLCSDQDVRHQKTLHSIAEQRDVFQQFANRLWPVLENVSTILNEVKTAIAGPEETSLAGQIQLLRTDHEVQQSQMLKVFDQDQGDAADHATLWRKLDKFAEMLSKAAAEQMMNALREVIADFNKNLTEQFGDNFKALDASVQKLVEWQERYRQELEQIVQYAQRWRRSPPSKPPSARSPRKRSTSLLPWPSSRRCCRSTNTRLTN